MNVKSSFLPVAILLLLAACGKKDNAGSSGLPSDFNNWSDSRKVEYMMQKTSPDSVARFIINSAIGLNEGVTLDSVGLVTNLVYSAYSTDDQVKFGDQYDSVVEGLDMPKRMKLYAKAGVENPQGMGYELGLGYLQRIRENNLSLKDVEKEIMEFEKACANDSDTYRRFMLGFKTALQYDEGTDIDSAVYQHFK